MPMLPLLIGSLASVGCLIGALVCLRRKRLIDDLPTSKTQGVFIGVSELKGTAESETPLTSYLGGIRCVQYEWKVEEHWSRTVTETYTDAQGHSGLHTRTESGWTVVASSGENPPFYLKDDTGAIRIVPEGASIHSVSTFDRTCGAGDPLYFAKAPLSAIANSTHQRRFKESALPLHAILYVMGQARERKDAVAAEIARDKAAPIFVISTKTEKQLSSTYVWWIWLWLVLGLLAAVGGAFVSKAMDTVGAGVSWQPFVFDIGIYLIALVAGWTWTVYNSLVTLRNRVNQAWSQVDIQLKRRADLIPNLVKCVEGYSSHEKAVQELVAELRSQTESPVRDGTLKGYSHTLMVVAERYPALKADRSFLALQKSLSDTEGRIALARGYFNDIVTFYNTRLEVIPDRFVGRMARLFRQNLIKAADLERISIEVHLAS
jgi:hypothetical protein